MVNAEGQGGQRTSSECVLEWNGTARVRIILENPEYTIRAPWVLYRLYTIMALVQCWRRSSLFQHSCSELLEPKVLREVSLECKVALRARNCSRFFPSYSLSLFLKGTLGTTLLQNKFWELLFWYICFLYNPSFVFSRNKDGSCLFSLAVVSDVAQGLGCSKAKWPKRILRRKVLRKGIWVLLYLSNNYTNDILED